MSPEVALALVAVVMTATIWFSMRLDGIRIQRHFAARGATVISRRWLPFGHGWLGSLHETIYQVRYRDEAGTEREATAYTSFLGGVHIERDRLRGG
jgi:hypothetical protein